MNNEFTKSKKGKETVYTLESASGGATGSGAVASVSSPIGGVRRRSSLIAQEGDTITVPVTQKPRQGPLRPQTGAGQHRDKKKEQKQGKEKHKKPFAEQGVAEGEQMSKAKALNALRKQLMNEYPYMKCGNLEEFKQRLQWLSEGMLKNHLTNDRDYKINEEEIALYQAYRKKREQIQQGSQGVAEGSPKDPNAPKKVQDRKTGKWYDPNKEFDKTMNSPEVKAQMKRMAQKEGVAEGSDPVWNKGTPMPKDYTCHCGLYVHPSVRNPKAIHAPDCPYAKQQGVAEGLSDGGTAVIYDNGYVKIDGKMYKAKRMNHESGMGIAIQTPSKMYFSPIQNEYEMPSVTIHRALKLGGLNPVFNEGVAEGSLNEGQYEMMLRNGQVKKFVAKDDADAKRIAAGHGAKSVIKLRGGVPAGKVSEQGVAEADHKMNGMSGLKIRATADTYDIINSNGEVLKQFHKTPKGLEYAKQFVKQNPHLAEGSKSMPKLPRSHFFDTWGGEGNGIAYTDNTHWWKIVDGKVVDFTNSPEGTKEWKREFVAKQRQGVAEGVAETMSMQDAVKVLRHYGADHFKTTSNELHFYKNGRPFSVDLIWGVDGVRTVSLSGLNSAARQLKGQGVAEEHNDTFDPKSHQYKTTMKHAKNPTVQQRMAAHDIKPGVAGYRDRVDLLKDLERTGKLKDQGVAEGAENNPVAQAIIRRILNQRPDLLQYGADLVGDAIDDVASFVGHVEEIGTSDVSAWVKQVEDYVKRTAQGRGDRLNEISDESLIKYLVGVHQDALKHKSDPTKRKPEKASKSVAGFSRAFNKLDARQAQELAPRVGEDIDNDTKSATFDPIKYHDFVKQNDELFRGMSSALQRRDEDTYQKLLTKYLSLHDRGRKGMVPEATKETGRPRIRKYSKLRPDGSKAVRYEVLDYRGMRIPGQGTEGFDDLKYAKEFFHRNYDKLCDPMDEGIEDRLKDLDFKNPVNIPAYRRRAASQGGSNSGDSFVDKAKSMAKDLGQENPTDPAGNFVQGGKKLGIFKDESTDEPVNQVEGRYWCKNEKRWKDVE